MKRYTHKRETSETEYFRGKRRRRIKRDFQWYTNVINKLLSSSDQLNILKQNDDFEDLLKFASKFSANEIYCLLQAFNQYKSSENNLDDIKEAYLDIIESNFIQQILEPIVKGYFSNSPSVKQIVIMIAFLTNCLKLLPIKVLTEIGLLFPGILVASQQFNDSSVKPAFDNLTSQLEIAKSAQRKINESSIGQTMESSVDVHDFRNLTVIPKTSDIFCSNDDVGLRPNRFVGYNNRNMESKYESVDDYLDTHFRLLKEDFVRPLRSGIKAIRDKNRTDKLAVRYYENVIIDRMINIRNGLAYKILFDVSKLRRMNWAKSRRFIYGSLLCFTNDFFETLYFASVIESNSNYLKKGILFVKFDIDPINCHISSNKYLMVETKNLFEAYRHVLSKLQTFTEETLPFVDHLVFASTSTKLPSYMGDDHVELIMSEALKCEDFDNSQRQAFVNALKSNLALIQGPPGTGKTFVGLKIIKFLVNHIQADNESFGPILVVCYTNHALDQFLDEIIEGIGIENVIRVGGRSKLDKTRECNITTMRHRWIETKMFEPSLLSRSYKYRQRIISCGDDFMSIYERFRNSSLRIMPLSTFYVYMKECHREYFKSNHFDNWILGKGDELENSFQRYSENKRSVVTEVQDECIKKVVYEMILKIWRELKSEKRKNMTEERNKVFEDSEYFSFDQRFLDEDTEIMHDSLEAGDEDACITTEEAFKYVANGKLILKRLSKLQSLTKKEYDDIESLDVDYDIRLRLYKYWIENYKVALRNQYEDARETYNKAMRKNDSVLSEETVAIMKSVKVIGMTTTGAARYGSVLDQLGCRVVVFEEVAEILESHVVCSLSKSCEHLIMIGDHQQLRPKVDVYELDKYYNLGISLFERFIANKCPYSSLELQHRMRPEISVCVKMIYPQLKDSDSVLHCKSIAGMNSDIYFFNHSYPEEDSLDMSYKNDFEAKFATSLCEYLIKCGNLQSQITILTLYSGQLYNISERMVKDVFEDVRVCVIDNFQGEENEIIILSLVRSNDEDKVGFVKSPNRLCVALSRAKRGFYVVGNIFMFNRVIKLFETMTKKYFTEQNIGSKLPLKCMMHPDVSDYFVTCLEDFWKNGCPSICGYILMCGHSCSWSCHRETPFHDSYKCRLPCAKMCKRGLHLCKDLCYVVCKCKQRFSLTMECGHAKTITCSDINIKCADKCVRVMDCGHKCEKLCNQPCLCEQLVTRVLSCGHSMETKCYIAVTTVKCTQICNKVLACTHNCREKCYQKCVCKQLITRELPCLHKRIFQCCVDILTIRCNAFINHELDCGHSVRSRCYEKVTKCVRKFNRKLICGHFADIECGTAPESVICERICGVKLDCFHECRGKCGQCYGGPLHWGCETTCWKPLKCGHFCDRQCHVGFCPPCDQQCVKYCRHSKCVKRCGEVCGCVACPRNCLEFIRCTKCNINRQCQLRCGEPCSKTCDRCSKDYKRNRQPYYIMEPCKCCIQINQFRPRCKVTENDVFLECQRCRKKLRSPYLGVVLIHFKVQYYNLFISLPEDKIVKWKELFEEFREIECVPDNFKNIIDNVCLSKIYASQIDALNTSFKFYVIVKEMLKTLSEINVHGTISKYFEGFRRLLFNLMIWLNPFIRRFTVKDINFMDLQKLKMNLMTDTLSYLNSLDVTQCALKRKQIFAVLDELEKICFEMEYKSCLKRLNSIKGNTENTENVRKEEEPLVSGIIESGDVYDDCKLYNSSIENQLKE